jgi:short-subunit dehydrogenase
MILTSHPSSGIGAALALEYGTRGTHLVLIAGDNTRLKDIAARAKCRGATASIHSIDLFEPANTVRLHRLLQEVNTQAKGIDIAISFASVTGHRIDVLAKNVEHIPPLDNCVAQPSCALLLFA